MKENSKKDITNISCESGICTTKNLKIACTVLTVVVLLLAAKVIFAKNDTRTITVKGESSIKLTNKTATYNVTVIGSGATNAAAVEDLNKKSTELSTKIKEIVGDKGKIENTNLNVYQEQNWDASTSRTVYGTWKANYDIRVKIKDEDATKDFANKISVLEINNFWGPNYTIEKGDIDDSKLTKEAILDAKEKAKVIAEAGNSKVGKMVSFSEENQYGIPMIQDAAIGYGGKGAEANVELPIEPGTSEVKRTIMVTFELKETLLSKLGLN